MVVELYVWGPALGLPSIDAECIAAISYLDDVLKPGEWRLNAVDDAAVRPYTLPAIQQHGSWISGYSAIVSYIEESAQPPARPVDSKLDAKQKADVLAYSSYISERGSALLAFSLYVSPSAWAEVTRPAYANLLPYPLTWTVPLRMREKAIAKTEQYGLENVATAIDSPSAAPGSKTMAPTTAAGFLRLPTPARPSGAMAPEQASAIRLFGLAEDFVSVLDDVRGASMYLLTADAPTSVDFLAAAYLQMMTVATPHRFLPRALEGCPAGRRLLQFVDHMSRTQGHTKAHGDLHPSLVGRQRELMAAFALPWQPPPPRGPATVLRNLLTDVAANLPGVGQAHQHWRGDGVVAATADGDGDGARAHTGTMLTVGSTALGIVAVAAALFTRSLAAPFGADTHRFAAPRRQQAGLLKFGAAGALLDDAMSLASPPPPAASR